MNKFFTFSSLLLSGMLLGSLAGRISVNELAKTRRNVSRNSSSVKNYLKRTEEEDINQYFI